MNVNFRLKTSPQQMRAFLKKKKDYFENNFSKHVDYLAFLEESLFLKSLVHLNQNVK